MKIKLIILSILIFAGAYPQTTTSHKIICDGVVHKKIINTIDTLSIDILKIDFSKNDFEFKAVKANNLLNDKATTSEMVSALTDSGHNVIAAINADFFEADGELINNMISNGIFVKAVKFTDSPFNDFVNTQFAVTDNKSFLMEQFVFSGRLILADGVSESINRINSKADSNSITLYNSFQGELTPQSTHNWYTSETPLTLIKNNHDTLYCVVSDSFYHGGNIKINSQYILSVNNKFAHYLEREIKLGDTLKIILGFNPICNNINTLLGGWPRLVKDGINLIKSDSTIEGVFPRFSKTKHPRTGIGISRDSTTIYFITVDGRQESSSGMSLDDFANLMIEQGIYQGLNFDGGGSTTMVINNKVVNSPSDQTGERKVGNCLMLIKKQKN